MPTVSFRLTHYKGDAFGIDERLHFELHGVDSDRDSSRGFWEVIAGEDATEKGLRGEYLRGVAEGALDVWETVKRAL